MTIPGTELMINDITTTDAQARVEDRIAALQEHILALTDELMKLSGRLELTMRLNARIVSKLDPSFLEDPHDPAVRERSRLLGETVLIKLKAEAISSWAGDLEKRDQMRRYFKDVP